MNRRDVLALLAVSSIPLSVGAQPSPRKHSAKELIAAARAQVGITLAYEPAYARMSFPGGDVPRSKGVCTDVIIRAYRDAFGIDLQQMVNADMRMAFSAYPTTWGLKRPDSNIDHRRVANLATFMKRRGTQLPLPESPKDWQPGDIFTSLINGKLPHIGLVSDRRGASAQWAVIHNIGQGTREEDALTEHALTGRYRLFLSA